MYNGDIIRLLLSRQKKQQKDLSMAVTGKPNSSLHNLFKNPTAKTLEAIADFFGVTIDSLFIRKGVYANLDDEADMEKAFLKRMVRYQETEISARQMMVDTNEYLLDQLKHRVAELESRLRYIQNHPEAISELEPLPEFKLIVPYVKGTDAPKVYTNPTPEEKRQARVHKKYAKIKEDEIREETLYDTPKKEEKD